MKCFICTSAVFLASVSMAGTLCPLDLYIKHWKEKQLLRILNFPNFLFLLVGFHVICCWRIVCHSQCSIPKCKYSTCTDNPASVRLILPPKLWQHYGHIGTQVEFFLPTIRAPHLRLSEQQSHKPQKNQFSFSLWWLFAVSAFRPRLIRVSFLFPAIYLCVPKCVSLTEQKAQYMSLAISYNKCQQCSS